MNTSWDKYFMSLLTFQNDIMPCFIKIGTINLISGIRGSNVPKRGNKKLHPTAVHFLGKFKFAFEIR